MIVEDEAGGIRRLEAGATVFFPRVSSQMARRILCSQGRVLPQTAHRGYALAKRVAKAALRKVGLRNSSGEAGLAMFTA